MSSEDFKSASDLGEKIKLLNLELLLAEAEEDVLAGRTPAALDFINEFQTYAKTRKKTEMETKYIIYQVDVDNQDRL